MKPIVIELNTPSESEIIQKALFKAGGSWSNSGANIKKTDKKYFFISEDLFLNVSSDEGSFESRKEYLISVSEALIILNSLIEKKPFLNRSGIKKKIPVQIDSYVLDQYIMICKHHGYDLTRRLENLIALDIKCRIKGNDIIEYMIKKDE